MGWGRRCAVRSLSGADVVCVRVDVELKFSSFPSSLRTNDRSVRLRQPGTFCAGAHRSSMFASSVLAHV